LFLLFNTLLPRAVATLRCGVATARGSYFQPRAQRENNTRRAPPSPAEGGEP
jgi:hypothetical protein